MDQLHTTQSTISFSPLEYHIRVDTKQSEEEILSFFTQERCSKFIVASEFKSDGTRHIHAYIFMILKLTTFRSQLISHFNLSGLKGSYSVSKKRSQTLGQYVVKEGDILGYGGFTAEEVQIWADQSYSKEKKKGFKTGSVMSQLVPLFIEQWDGGQMVMNKVLDFIYKFYLNNLKIFPSDFKMKDMMWTLMANVLYHSDTNIAGREYRLRKLVDYKIDVVLGQELIMEF